MYVCYQWWVKKSGHLQALVYQIIETDTEPIVEWVSTLQPRIHSAELIYLPQCLYYILKSCEF